MLISFISNKNFAYINLHAEQSFRDFKFLNLSSTNYHEDDIHRNSEMGIYCKDLKIGVIEELLQSEKLIREKKAARFFSCIIIDFNNIKKIQPNMSENFRTFFQQTINISLDILLINVDVYLLAEIQSYVESFKNDVYRDDKNQYVCIIKCDNKKLDYIENFKEQQYILQITEQMFEEEFNRAIDSCCETNDNPLDSSPVYTSRYINIKKCIETIEFFPYAIYKLASKLINENIITTDFDKNNKVSLFCHTLNGAYIASLLSSLLCIDLVFLDHIGPINRLFKTFLNNHIDKNKSYIIVTDVICLGSELRAVKTLLDYADSKCIGAVSIVNCRTVNRLNLKDKRYSLLELTKDYNPIKYYISTDLTIDLIK